MMDTIQMSVKSDEVCTSSQGIVDATEEMR